LEEKSFVFIRASLTTTHSSKALTVSIELYFEGHLLAYIGIFACLLTYLPVSRIRELVLVAAMCLLEALRRQCLSYVKVPAMSMNTR